MIMMIDKIKYLACDKRDETSHQVTSTLVQNNITGSYKSVIDDYNSYWL
jgi:hypothetical protein